VFTDPVLAYTAPGEINNLAWSPPVSSMGSPAIPGGEWLAMAIGKTVKVLRV
jgi:WD repeat-containing protein 68